MEIGSVGGLVTSVVYPMSELRLDPTLILILDRIGPISKILLWCDVTMFPKIFLQVFLVHSSTTESKHILFVVAIAWKTFSRAKVPVAGDYSHNTQKQQFSLQLRLWQKVVPITTLPWVTGALFLKRGAAGEILFLFKCSSTQLCERPLYLHFNEDKCQRQ